MKRYATRVLLIAVVQAAATALAFGAGIWGLGGARVTGGGGLSAGAAYQLRGAVGQYEAGVLRGGRYVLRGGFAPESNPERAPTGRTWALYE